MAYLISEEAQDLLKDVKKFCDNEVREQCKEYDKSGEWPKEIYDKAIEQGYQALEVPEMKTGFIARPLAEIVVAKPASAIAISSINAAISTLFNPGPPYFSGTSSA